MKKTLKRVGLLLLSAGVVLGIIFFTQYPKLTVISGYAAKDMASQVFLAGRDPESVRDNDLQVPLISLSEAQVDGEHRAASASVFGLQSRTAVYRQGLGSVLLPKGTALPEKAPSPKRVMTPSPLPYPMGQAAPADSIIPGVDYGQLRKGIDQAFRDPEIQRTRTVMVLYKGHLVGERYVEGFGPDTPVLGWSMTKSVLATVYGILEYQGKIELETPAPVPSWQGDERKGITFDHLLRMQSGLAWDEDYSGLSDVTRMLFLEADMAANQAEKSLAGPPGSLWNYSSGTSNLLSGLLRQQFTTYQDYLDFPYREFIDRIGMHSMVLETDFSGSFVGSSYGWASTRDWGRFGLLYLRRGDWFGDRLFDTDWVDYVTRPTPGSGSRYGAHFWLNADRGFPDVPEDMFMANGHQGQHVFIIPSRELVVVRTGLAEGPDFDANAFLREVLAAFPGAQP
ncbi:serine hydrolase domain-containing protein [Robiginitalea marina]|uniref:Beta-lactamase family protein n=1 Tax=Robiginitalea marina TaxID=2954105 RepID=A0ABT1AVA2_9FLAO|nr:serine hydrolase [Robiginitalea marina]MCO5723537.1 beta-lactamase family protein [Robiginitalea marina]